MSSPQDTTRNSDDATRERWSFVVIPLCVVLAVAFLAMAMTMVRRRYGGPLLPGAQPSGHARARRRHLQQQYQQRIHPYYQHRDGGVGGAAAANEYIPPSYAQYSQQQRRDDLEEALTRGFRPQQQQPGQGQGQQARTTTGSRIANRWAWALGAGRREEGLNELGEAPPPYIGRDGGDGHDKATTEGVEMASLNHGGGGTGGGGGGAAATVNGSGEGGSSEGRTMAPTGQHQPSQPPMPGAAPALPLLPPAYGSAQGTTGITPPARAALVPEARG